MSYLRQNSLFERLGIGATRRGVGDYDRVGDWTWEYYPPPYDFLAPADSVAIPAPLLYTQRGMSGCHCGGTCGGCSRGMGLFDSGFDISQWGTPEWVAAGVGFYLVAKILGDLGRGGQKIRRAVRSRSSRSRRKQQLQKELSEL